MRTVGVKQLKAKLSEYLRAVRAGEVFLVTDRDEVIAELRPPGTASLPAEATGSAAAALLAELASGGEAAPPSLTKDGWEWKPAGAGLTPGTAARILDDMRSDRSDGGTT